MILHQPDLTPVWLYLLVYRKRPPTVDITLNESPLFSQFQGTRDTLTDSDSGCVSPGSRMKDSASPELKRMDSGYKSPHQPGSPCHSRRGLTVPSHDEFKEEFAKAQVSSRTQTHDGPEGKTVCPWPAPLVCKTLFGALYTSTLNCNFL